MTTSRQIQNLPVEQVYSALGSSREGLAMHGAHGHASLGLAWSDDLETWRWPGQT